MTTLYRQYRPTRFSELVGQEQVSSTLQRAIERNKVAHAYLFYGARGTGKTSSARILAKRLNCTGATDAEPCTKCDQCRAAAEGRHIDVIEIDAASNRGIDDIRALKEGIGLAPAIGKYKVYIIDEVHMLTNEAFTALLKTLEEPVKHAVFILATTELHKVPDTILSRCQVFRFRRATADELRQRLEYLLKQEKREVDPAVLDFIIQRSDGCYRDAESLLGQLLTLSTDKVNLSSVTEFLGLPPLTLIDEFLLALIRGQSAPAITACDQAFAQGFDPEQLVKEAITRSRDIALSIIQKTSLVTPAFANEPRTLTRLPNVLRALVQAMQDLAYMPQPMIAIHLAVLTLCNEKGASLPQVSTPQTQVTATKPASHSTVAKVDTSKSVTKSKPTKVGALSIEKANSLWPTLIQDIKQLNPVASTFLRAMEIKDVEEGSVTLQAQYTLHRNFFVKPANKLALEKSFSKLIGDNITLKIVLKDAQQAMQEKPEQELLATVREVFGSP